MVAQAFLAETRRPPYLTCVLLLRRIVVAAPHERQTTIISTKGQVILPKAIRDQRHWPAGMRLTVESTPDGVLLRPAAIFPPTSVEKVFGSLPYAGKAKSIDEMDAAVVVEAKRRARD
jgi:AbrB family looped-hinge helix DNA binding protein